MAPRGLVPDGAVCTVGPGTPGDLMEVGTANERERKCTRTYLDTSVYLLEA